MMKEEICGDGATIARFSFQCAWEKQGAGGNAGGGGRERASGARGSGAVPADDGQLLPSVCLWAHDWMHD